MCSDEDVVTGVPVHFPPHDSDAAAVQAHELELIRSKEAFLHAAGWATAERRTAGECSAEPAVAVVCSPGGGVKRCKNCQSWFSSLDFDVEAGIPVAGEGAGDPSARQLLSPRTRLQFKCQFHPGAYRQAGVTCASGTLTFIPLERRAHERRARTAVKGSPELPRATGSGPAHASTNCGIVG